MLILITTHLIMKRSFRMISQILIVLSDTEEILNSDSDEENKPLYLMKMGYSDAEASIAMERCGPDSSIVKLTDFICVVQMAKATDTLLMKQRKLENKLLNEDDHAVHLSIPMIGSRVPTETDQITQITLPEDAIGSPYFYYEQINLLNLMISFGVYTKSDQITQRTLSEDAIESPYFYYENVALAPVNVWTGILQYLFDVEPEFVDSKHFHAATLKRAIFIICQLRTNFLLSCFLHALYMKGSVRLLKLMTMSHLRVSRSFPKNHTRGGGSARDMFPDGINVMSLFSGISDAEVAFYCLGIPLKTNVQELNDDLLEQLMSRFGRFDLVVGGIKRNNLTGRNKHHQDELEYFFVGAFSCNDCYDNSLFSCSNISHSFRIMERFS
ncbi:hypothetical protein F3Y22_tig00111105pilonHSYRG00786 [Hibiscus syriacus]|uniref:DNA (Cytosine-5)-methyltransferase DRM1/2 n=1 Tax=Hibiscus syriacus TaxID=106335 RepID=A0A6A2Z018_HIBSY|nr:hypothetical protein F3Y22_tig00111105pilonHSYRG00786 [Hibiscus syriacus]